MTLRAENPYTNAVAAGAALLDATHPGWHEEIDLDELNLRMPCDCILGQLYGVFSVGAAKLADKIEVKDAETAMEWGEMVVEYGFDVSRNSNDYNNLQTAWVKEIRARRPEDEEEE